MRSRLNFGGQPGHVEKCFSHPHGCPTSRACACVTSIGKNGSLSERYLIVFRYFARSNQPGVLGYQRAPCIGLREKDVIGGAVRGLVHTLYKAQPKVSM